MTKPESTARTERARLRVGFILTRRFTICAFANFVDVLRLASDEGDRSRPILCNWRVLSADMNPVKSSSGVSVQPDERLGDPTRFDYIVVIGGLMGELEQLEPAYSAFLHRAAGARIPLVGVCTGSFVLHGAGLLEGYRCCVSWFHHNDFLEQFDGLVPVSDQIFVVDRDRLTCSGGTSSAHLAAYLVERHISRSAARKSLSIMMIDEAMEADRPQPGLPLDLTTSDPVVRRTLLLLQQSLESPPTVSTLAARLKISPRTLERHFHSALKITPFEAGKRIRLAHAERLLQRTQRSVTQIAQETGFSDVSHFIRVFKTTYKTTPEVWRAQQELHIVAQA
ncbi:GlxA family transcriptional regulator [Primorskyibacter flagellatus]|uniref:GlxA family transcriptional regulator n=1 Tax=Primorskyibacter flagellatus TaxID=1387277 RepID=UPI003A941E97